MNKQPEEQWVNVARKRGRFAINTIFGPYPTHTEAIRDMDKCRERLKKLIADDFRLRDMFPYGIGNDEITVTMQRLGVVYLLGN